MTVGSFSESRKQITGDMAVRLITSMAVILISSYLAHNRKIVSFNKYILSENGRWGSKETKQTKIWIRLNGNKNRTLFYFRTLLSFARVRWT